MKRLLTLLLVAIFALGCVGAAKADGIDLKVQGQWDFAFGWAVNNAFTDNVNRRTSRSNDDFIARHRIRTQVNFITSEYLEAVLMFEIGNLDWGRGGSSGRSSGGALDADGVNVETKRAYLNWVIPSTEISVQMGIQGLKLPSTPMGSPVFDADVAGVVVSSPITSWWSVTAFWIRPFDAYYNDTDSGFANRHLDDELDAFGLIMPFKGDGWQFSPWGIYGRVGASSGVYDYLFTNNRWSNTNDVQNESTHVWWAGAHLKVDILDPLIFNFEGIYGRLGGNQVNFANLRQVPAYPGGTYARWAAADEIKARGYFLAATLDYKLDWGTPGIFGWYASGDGKRAARDGKIGRMPVLGNDTGSFKPTSFGTAGKLAIDTDAVISGTGTGTWGVGAKIADMSFIEDLNHVIRVAYYRGTNRHEHVENGNAPLRYQVDGVYLTDKDSVWEVNFDHTYNIYENLTAVVELGWLHLDTDKDVWRNVGSANKDEKSNAWKAQLLFQYKF